MRFWPVTLFVVLALGCAACGEEEGAGPGPGPVKTEPEPDPPDEVNQQELDEDISSAEEVTDLFWRKNWSRFFTQSYSPPTVEGVYDGEGPDAPTCGGEPLSADNAYYCKPDDFVAWDRGLLEKGFATGDSWVYLVVSHEWGHAVQARLSTELQTQNAELQADCLAGATLYGASQQGDLTFDAGDEKELVKALTELADETAWTQTADHGDAFERVEAFNAGRRGGVQRCLPNQTS